MASLEIRRPVALRVIVTEEFKQQVRDELKEGIEQTRRDIERMEFEGRRVLADLQRVDLNQAMAARRELETQKERLEALTRQLQEQLQDVDKWELDSERVRGTIESTVQISAGDNFWEKVQNAAIVIRDGIVTEIRGE